jgi:hypothetical protein
VNDENLKKGVKTQFKSGEDAAKNGAKGGKVAQANRKKRKELKEAMIAMLDAKYPDKQGNTHTGTEIIVTELFKAATDRKSRNYNRSLDQLLALTGLGLTEEDAKRIQNALTLQAQEIELNKKKMEKMDEEWL